MDSICQIFVCATPGEGRCGEKGGSELLQRFREEVTRRDLPLSAVQRGTCSRRHHEGPLVFIFPDDIWYTRVTLDEVLRIVEKHFTRRASQA